jgi:glycosyltransferase involved in cell wall biosynthesis
LLSILDQTHQNWECIVVDDASLSEHKERLSQLVQGLNCDRIRLLWLPENRGQLMAFFAGLSEARAEFVCLLDPDDRYAKTFLADSVSAHLNHTVVCPMVCSDQYMLVNGQVTSAVRARHRLTRLGGANRLVCVDGQKEELLYIPVHKRGWQWTSSSSFMFRRAALEYLRPAKALTYKICADAYLARGAHVMGGSLFLMKPLVYRTLHETNSFSGANLFSSFQKKRRGGESEAAGEYMSDALAALRHNKAPIKISGTRGWALPKRWRASLAKRWARMADG